MKIIDCTSFFNEHMMYEVRLNILKDKVDKFIVTESTFSHSGKKKKLNFDINNYPKFKDKITYIVVDKQPENILLIIYKSRLVNCESSCIFATYKTS